MQSSPLSWLNPNKNGKTSLNVALILVRMDELVAVHGMCRMPWNLPLVKNQNQYWITMGKEYSTIPVLVKLTPNVGNILPHGLAAQARVLMACHSSTPLKALSVLTWIIYSSTRGWRRINKWYIVGCRSTDCTSYGRPTRAFKSF